MGLEYSGVPFPPPDWIMKTSFPRTLSSISTRVSPPLNLASSTFAGPMPRWLQMVLFARQHLSEFFFDSRRLLSELRVRAAAEDDNVAHHDDGGGGGALLRPRTNRCRRKLFREQCARTRSDCWGLVAEGALEEQRFQSIVLYSRAEASRAVTFHVPRFGRLASLFFRRPPLPPQRARNSCMHTQIKRPSLSSSRKLHLLHAIHCVLIMFCVTTAQQSHFSLHQRRSTAHCGYHVRALALETWTLTSHTPRNVLRRQRKRTPNGSPATRPLARCYASMRLCPIAAHCALSPLPPLVPL
jgi:hypothetical protein